VLVNPPPRKADFFARSEQNDSLSFAAWHICNRVKQCTILQSIYNFQASLNHIANACSCFHCKLMHSCLFVFFRYANIWLTSSAAVLMNSLTPFVSFGKPLLSYAKFLPPHRCKNLITCPRQGCQILLGTWYQKTGKNVPNEH
jgi:hypothetical protein